MLRQLDVKRVVIFGGSLGGHVGFELVALLAGSIEIEVNGLMITGAPPVCGLEQAVESFNLDPNSNIAGEEVLSDAQIDLMIRFGCGTPPTPELEQMVRQADGRARKYMTEAMLAGKVTDARRTVKEMSVPLAVVNGANDPFLKLDVLDRLEYGNFWKGKCIRIGAVMHSPYWERPEMFLPLFEEFVRDCETTVS